MALVRAYNKAYSSRAGHQCSDIQPTLELMQESFARVDAARAKARLAAQQAQQAQRDSDKRSERFLTLVVQLVLDNKPLALESDTQ